MGRKNRMIIIAAVCISVFMMLSFAAVTGVQKHVRKNASIRSLLHGVNAASNYLNEKSIGYAYWKDPLSYVSGYELAAFEVDAEEWISPVGWRHETITAAELGDVTGFAVPERRFIDMEIDLPAVYDEWYFVMTMNINLV